MSKHPHRIMLRDKKTWRCMIPGCRYFIHLGLTHTLEGQTIICWECGDQFTCVDRTIQHALKDDMPKCPICLLRLDENFDVDESNRILEEKGMLEKPTGLAAFGGRKENKVIDFNPPKKEKEEDKPESIEDEGGHAADCDVWESGDCNCK